MGAPFTLEDRDCVIKYKVAKNIHPSRNRRMPRQSKTMEKNGLVRRRTPDFLCCIMFHFSTWLQKRKRSKKRLCFFGLHNFPVDLVRSKKSEQNQKHAKTNRKKSTQSKNVATTTRKEAFDFSWWNFNLWGVSLQKLQALAFLIFAFWCLSQMFSRFQTKRWSFIRTSTSRTHEKLTAVQIWFWGALRQWRVVDVTPWLSAASLSGILGEMFNWPSVLQRILRIQFQEFNCEHVSQSHKSCQWRGTERLEVKKISFSVCNNLENER